MTREELAKNIYNDWTQLGGWVPWVDGGNSLMQDKARDEAAKQLPLEQRSDWEPWQQRVIDESKDLSEKIQKLGSYIFNGKQDHVSDIDFNLLVEQMKHMNGYSIVLRDRIARFNLASA
jgi:hypothetical protein